MTNANKLSQEWLSTVKLARLFKTDKGITRRALIALRSEMPDKIKSVKHGKIYYWYLHNDAFSLETFQTRLQVNDRNGDWLPVRVLAVRLGMCFQSITKALYVLRQTYPDSILVKMTAKNTNLYLRSKDINLLTEYFEKEKTEWLTVLELRLVFKHNVALIKQALLAMQEYAPDRVKMKQTEKNKALYLHKDKESMKILGVQLKKMLYKGLSCMDMAKESGYSRETVRKIFVMLTEDAPDTVVVLGTGTNKRIFLRDDKKSKEEFYAYLRPKTNSLSMLVNQYTR